LIKLAFYQKIVKININNFLNVEFSPRRGKSSFSIGFLSKSANDEKKELSSMISDRITASGIASQFKQSQGKTFISNYHKIL